MLDIAYGREDPLLAAQKGIIDLEGLGDDSSNLVRFYNRIPMSKEDETVTDNMGDTSNETLKYMVCVNDISAVGCGFMRY